MTVDTRKIREQVIALGQKYQPLRFSCEALAKSIGVYAPECVASSFMQLFLVATRCDLKQNEDFTSLARSISDLYPLPAVAEEE